jgi:gamma-glutamylcyclotransferase (GGCT)/AIG2-like uncharacterized protein YtfP
MSERLFVYGTLHPDRAPVEIADVVQRFVEVGRGTVRGRLFNCGAYPGVVLDSGAKTVDGMVFAVAEDALPKLDAYEGFEPSKSAESLFLRIRTEVMMDGGKKLLRWVYVWNRG